ncbi:hypothetical protein SLE2022_309860 [Rubroshorea leprosula]
MQSTEMKSLRSLYIRKSFLFLHPPKTTNHLSFRFLARHSPQFSRQFHSTNPHFRAEESVSAQTGEAPRGWSVYRDVGGGLDAKKTQEKSCVQERSSGSDGEGNIGFSIIDEKDADFVAEGRNEEVKNENLSIAENTPGGLSDSDNEGGVFSKEMTDRSIKKAGLDNVYRVRDTMGIKKKGKGKVSFVCEDCGQSEGQWWGMCPSCGSAGKMKRFYEEETKTGTVAENVIRSWLPQKTEDSKPVRLTDVMSGVNKLDWRIRLSGSFGNEVARVLGGGLVPGSVVLIGGDPGVGKSTLLLQMAAIIAEGPERGPVVYVSGEESIDQISNRADRMEIGAKDLFLYSSTDIEDILAKIQPLSPRALMVDSIQTVYINEVTGGAGSLMQLKECTSALLRFAKKTGIPVILVGHVTKSGEIAGPRILEHIVDVVMYLEGEKYSSHRLLRAVKNRFGSIDELGIFEMSQLGLQAVSSPSEMFLSGDQHSDSEFLAGLAVAVIMDASRAFLIEIQALCVSGSTASRHVNGIQASRADMIISVLNKQVGLKIQENAVFLNVVSGITLTETAGDLAIAAAICSSFLECPIPSGIAFIAEIGLAGELRMVPRMEKRIGTVAKLGYKKCIVPKSAVKSLATLELEEMELIGCADLKDVINSVFR